MKPVRHSGLAGLVTLALVFSGSAGTVVGLGTAVSHRVSSDDQLRASADGAVMVSSGQSDEDAAAVLPAPAVVSASSKPTPKPTPTPKPKPTPKAVVTATTHSVVDDSWPDDDGSGCPAPRWPTKLSAGEPGNGRRVLVIGDSRTRDSRLSMSEGMVSSGWTPTVRCWGWKEVTWGTEQVRRAKARNELPKIVVIALGINDIGRLDASMIRRHMVGLLDAIGPGHQVLWLEEYSTRSHQTFSNSHVNYPPRVTAFNANLRDLRDSYPNLSIIPWVSVVKANKLGLFDGIHYGKRGYRFRAQAIVDGLNSIVG